ncbi:aromatic ring-hydroxylating dioxygenase subunit alpha [uncultured Piscinibacter sp.]|uniref:aromatic ring-hydroxylating oxygenase subunit alpha n=1 Tax=uncultured Piscinibacter sp. TaxID=1131835 RepID=UPI002633B255|nr:aromatic ring-hydroxylating dioxygenase subunit alpha [uncultured Piscinibacter sp.]
MAERRFAHPVLDAPSLGEAPVAVRLLGEEFVLWRDGDGQPRAARDRCPHRGTRLSLGRVCDGQIECPYHGWRFDAAGRCVDIPALPGFTPPASHGLAVSLLGEAHGLLWLHLDADAVLPRFDAEGDARLRKLNVGPYDVAASAPRIVENFLDLAHFGFVHEGWLGDRGHTALADYRIEPTATGFVAQGCRAWQPQSNRLAAEGSWVDYRYEVTAPYAAVLTKLPQRQDGYRDEIALFVCPVDEERSRVWFRMALTDFDSSDEDLRAFQHTIFTQDQPVLESQSPRRLPLTRGEVHCAADRSSAAYRRFLREAGITFGVVQ